MAAVDRVFSAINSNDVEAFKQMMVPEGTNISLRLSNLTVTAQNAGLKTNLQEIAEAGAEKRRDVHGEIIGTQLFSSTTASPCFGRLIPSTSTASARTVASISSTS